MEWLVLRVGILDVAHEPVVVRFGAGVAETLDRPVLENLRSTAKVRKLPWIQVLGEIFGRDFRSGLEQRDLHPAFGQLLSGPTPGGARSHHDRVEYFFRTGNLGHIG